MLKTHYFSHYIGNILGIVDKFWFNLSIGEYTLNLHISRVLYIFFKKKIQIGMTSQKKKLITQLQQVISKA